MLSVRGLAKGCVVCEFLGVTGAVAVPVDDETPPLPVCGVGSGSSPAVVDDNSESRVSANHKSGYNSHMTQAPVRTYLLSF